MSERRMQALDAARAATAALEALGTLVMVTGSLARGRFGPQSDIDLLVTACQRALKYAIEGIVEDAMPGFRFDVIYLDELPPWKVDGFIAGAVHARDLL